MTKYTKDEKAVALLTAAVTALAEYRDYVREKYGKQCYQVHASRDAMADTKELLRDERRGWTDL